ncbi:hypothetical protein [Embleya sp. NPDC050493]|uniref:hypothetical protein n=1 Tax=Embleya sp. NPDC050493 TaxID=3363989 RepID=UPI0037A50A69
MGLLEERETAARVRVEELRAEVDRVLALLRDAEVLLERRVVAVEELAEALDARVPVEQAVDVEPVPIVVKPARSGSVVPHWRAGTAVAVLAPDYRRIVALVDEGGGVGLRAKDPARELGLEPVPAKLEGVRSKAKRLVTRGWLAEEVPGVFTPRPADGPRPSGGPGGGS